jgi:hypothetical protein
MQCARVQVAGSDAVFAQAVEHGWSALAAAAGGPVPFLACTRSGIAGSQGALPLYNIR